MMMYDIHMHLDSFNSIISDGLKYITTTFNINARKTINIVCLYRAHSCSIFTFLNNFQTMIQESLKHCLIIIMPNFNVDILKDNNQPKRNKNYYISFIFQLNHNLVKPP